MDPKAPGTVVPGTVVPGPVVPGTVVPSTALIAPVPSASGLCQTCFGPASPGSARCFQCGLHLECAPGSLASVVVPVAYAVKGSPHARRLWLYKSGRPGAEAARSELAVLLVMFLREHGSCVWSAAGSSGAGWTAAGSGPPPGPTHLAVVPSSRGRGGPHPLRSLAEPYLRLPWASLRASSGAHAAGRDLDPERFRADALDRARVLLLDDTWTTGASAQSATMALRRAGASGVAVVVLGRHLAAAAAACLTTDTFFRQRCAVHRAGGRAAQPAA